MQSAAELRVEAVDYIQQDMTGQPVNQTAETLAILVDTTAAASELQAAKTLLKQVLHNMTCYCHQSVPTYTQFASSLSSYSTPFRPYPSAHPV